jgi:hypothetical protein
VHILIFREVLRKDKERRCLDTAAAESCYWRALINGWSKVAKTESDEKWDEGEEIRWETFSLTGKTEWE